MHRRIAGVLAVLGFAVLAAGAGRAVHAAATTLGAHGLSLGPMAMDGAHGYTTGFYLVVLVTLAAAGALSMTALYLAHGRRTHRVRVRVSHPTRGGGERPPGGGRRH